jgi:hypothetical protein
LACLIFRNIFIRTHRKTAAQIFGLSLSANEFLKKQWGKQFEEKTSSYENIYFWSQREKIKLREQFVVRSVGWKREESFCRYYESFEVPRRRWDRLL